MMGRSVGTGNAYKTTAMAGTIDAMPAKVANT